MLGKSIEAATSHHHLPGSHSNHTSVSIDAGIAIEDLQGRVDRDMEGYSFEEALDRLLSMYKVCAGFACNTKLLTAIL